MTKNPGQTGPLNLAPNLSSADDFYASLLAVHEGLSKAQSDALNARLILILANHVGDDTVLAQALRVAAETCPESGDK